MFTLFLFSDYTGMFDAGTITPEYKTLIKIDGVKDGTLSLGSRNYPIVDGQAIIPLEAWQSEKIEVIVTAKQGNTLKHWSCETLTKKFDRVYTMLVPDGREILLQLRRENENLLAANKKNAADIRAIKDQLKSKFITGGTT